MREQARYSAAPQDERFTRFAGYAAVFDAVDRGGDVIRRGAFAGARPVPLRWEHGAEIGRVESLVEDRHGLRVIAASRRAVAPGMGLSIGYRVRAARDLKIGRELIGLELIEVSLVRFPMQAAARVIAVEPITPDSRFAFRTTLKARGTFSPRG
ncbi:HK97 family phage prohead protease [Sphingomonas sp. ID1715]|nr:HK97 family phage prohead protease [Sphingomonas sp. ID1715]